MVVLRPSGRQEQRTKSTEQYVHILMILLSPNRFNVVLCQCGKNALAISFIPLQLALLIEFQLDKQLFHLGSGPGGFAQKRQAGFDAGVGAKAFKRYLLC
jgi:hypothetical protein